VIFRELIVEGFKRLETCKWGFAPGLNVVRGPNEAGKSTLQDALVTAMFGDVGGTARALRDRLTWGREEMYRLAVKAQRKDGQEFELEKDFRSKNGAMISYADGTAIEGRKAVAEHLGSLTSISTEDSYLSTGCLKQGDFANIRAGKELSALLQEAVTGGAIGVNPETILKDLDARVERLEIGLKGQAKTPGPIKAKQDQIAELTAKLERARHQLADREQAQDTLDRCTREIARLEGELRDQEAVRDRVTRRRELEEKLQATQTEAGRLQETVNAAKGHAEKVAELQRQIADTPGPDAQALAEIRQLLQKAETREQDAAGFAEESTKHEACVIEPGQPGCESRAGALGEALSQASRLQGEVGEARAKTAALRAEADREQSALGAVMARRRGGQMMAFAGIALILIGVGAEVLSRPPVFYLCAGLGLLVGFLGLTRTAKSNVATAHATASAATARASESDAAARAVAGQLQAILQANAAATVEELRVAWEEARAADAEEERQRGAIASLAESAKGQAQSAAEEAADLRAQAHAKLTAAGFRDADEMQAAVRARASVEEGLGREQAALAATLQGATLADLEARLRDEAVALLGLGEALNTAEMTAARLSPEEFQNLENRIDAVRRKLAELGEQQQQARITLGIATADAEDVGSLEGTLADTQADLERLKERRDVYVLTRDVLAAAKQETMARASDLVAPLASEYIMDMTGGRYRKVWLEETTFTPHVAIPEQGEDSKCEIGQLSCATIEQIYLAIRLALTQLLFQQEPLPILLDDPFVNFDEARREAALKLIKEISKDHQVLLFTCSDEYDRYADHVVPLEGVCTLM
jgi:uncharacterized protein YhaN